MTATDKALDLALEALEKSVAACFDRCAHEQVMSRPEHFINQAITAIKQARALVKKAENARELGLDYEPAPKQRWAVFCRFCNKEWSVSYKHPGKSVCVDCDDAPPAAQPAPVQQEPVGLIARLKHPEQHYEFTDPKKANAVLMSLCQEAADALAAPVQEPFCFYYVENGEEYFAPKGAYVPDNAQPLYTTAAQPAPVQDLPFGVGGGLVAIKTLLSRDPCVHANTAIEMIDAILKEHPAAQPAVPDAFGTREGEHPQYIQGWNDCRAEMLKGMKP
jgi:hypothetical protein